jgi:hypothetical protein
MDEPRTDAGASTDGGDGPLLAALREMIRTDGHDETAELLGVSERTLQRVKWGERDGHLTEQLCRALEQCEAGRLKAASG